MAREASLPTSYCARILLAEIVRSVGNAVQPALAAAAEAAQPLAAAAQPYVQPVVAAAAPYVRRLQPLAAHAVAAAAPHAQAAAQWANRQAGALEPWQLMLLTAVATLLLARLLRLLRTVTATIQDKGEEPRMAAAPASRLPRDPRETCGHRQGSRMCTSCLLP